MVGDPHEAEAEDSVEQDSELLGDLGGDETGDDHAECRRDDRHRRESAHGADENGLLQGADAGWKG